MRYHRVAIGVLGDTFPQVLHSPSTCPHFIWKFSLLLPFLFLRVRRPYSIFSIYYYYYYFFLNFLLLIFSLYFNLQDAGYHFVAVVFFLSASVDLAYVTYGIGQEVKLAQVVLALLPAELLKIYRLYISAVVRKTHKFIVQNIKGTLRSWRMRYPN